MLADQSGSRRRPAVAALRAARRGRHPCWRALPFILALPGFTIMSSPTPTKTKGGDGSQSTKLGETAQKVLIDIFRSKDAAAVDRYFVESLIQHDPNIADGLSGMKAFASEVAKSPTADITIFRTLVDGDRVLVHSRYEGLK